MSDSNFEWTTGPIGTPRPGEMLVRNLWYSFDPTQVLNMAQPRENGGTPIGHVMRGIGVSEVVESHLPGFQGGDLVRGTTGWEDFSVIDGTGFIPTYKVPDGVPPNLALGTLGLTGMVAYFGMVEVGHPGPGETVVVSAAAGGVGSIAVQIAKIRGARTIGITGGGAKAAWLRDVLRLDAVIDHRAEDVAQRLTELCPEGLDVFFDNVGGPVLDTALGLLRPYGRIVLCGVTSWYLEKEPPPGPARYTALIMKNGRMEGLLGRDLVPRFPEALPVMQAWLRDGRLVSEEDVAEGLENAPRLLGRMFKGENRGKQLLHLADPTRRPPGEPPDAPGPPDPVVRASERKKG